MYYMTSRPVPIRLDELTHEAWKAQARSEGLTLSEWVRRRVGVVGASPVVETRTGPRVAKANTVDSTPTIPTEPRKIEKALGMKRPPPPSTVCPHRIPVTAYCSKCDF